MYGAALTLPADGDADAAATFNAALAPLTDRSAVLVPAIGAYKLAPKKSIAYYSNPLASVGTSWCHIAAGGVTAATPAQMTSDGVAWAQGAASNFTTLPTTVGVAPVFAMTGITFGDLIQVTLTTTLNLAAAGAGRIALYGSAGTPTIVPSWPGGYAVVAGASAYGPIAVEAVSVTGVSTIGFRGRRHVLDPAGLCPRGVVGLDESDLRRRYRARGRCTETDRSTAVMAGLANNNNPFQSQVRIGPNYIQLVPGPPGPAGTSAVVVTTTANFTQPNVGSNVTVNVTSTTPFGAGLGTFIVGGGYYVVASITNGTQMVLTNLGSTGNVSPGGTVPINSLVVPTGPPAQALEVENGGAAITQRPILNLIGLVYADNPGNSSMDFTTSALVGPGTAISTNYTLPADQTLLVFQDGPYVIDLHLIAPNREYVMLARGAGTLNGAGQVTLSSGSATFSIEDPMLPTGGGLRSQFCGYDAESGSRCERTIETYRFAWDTTANLLTEHGLTNIGDGTIRWID